MTVNTDNASANARSPTNSSGCRVAGLTLGMGASFDKRDEESVIGYDERVATSSGIKPGYGVPRRAALAGTAAPRPNARFNSLTDVY